MTDEAKSDLERLAVIRKQREDAAALRQAQSNGNGKDNVVVALTGLSDLVTVFAHSCIVVSIYSKGRRHCLKWVSYRCQRKQEEVEEMEKASEPCQA